MKRLWIGLALFMCAWILLPAEICQAELADEHIFENAVWEQVMEGGIQGSEGVVQSICATENYIICIENTSDWDHTADIVSAYYRKNVDENGAEVEPYTLAKQVSNMDWEHGNGMAYNPNTHEIYVSLYTNTTDETRGCLYVMNPDTLEYVRTIKISDDYNILGIGYKADTDQYVIQTDVDGGYSMKVLDANFQVVEELGDYAGAGAGDNFQDLTVNGDYIMNFPLTLGMGIGDFIHVYSISRKQMVSTTPIDWKFENVSGDEPESICELEPGVFLAVVNVVRDDGSSAFRLYKTTVPYYFQIKTAAQKGKVAVKTEKVLRGESVKVKLAPEKKYELSELLVNQETQKVTAEDTSYTIENVQGNLEVQAVFTKIPLNIGRIFGIAALVAAALVSCSIYYYILLIRRERKRKYLRAKRRRERMRQRMEEIPYSK